jgi:anti-sigma-K factor RskA
MRRREEEVRDDFHRAGALQALDSKSLADVGLEENHTVRRMIKRAVIHESEPGMYYFDEEVWQSVRAWRRRRVIALLAAVAVAAIISLYFVSTFR